MSIKLHPKYGLNASVRVCFVCGKETNELVMLGRDSYRLTGREEAPRTICLDRKPCATCQKWMKSGIICISVRNNEKNPANPYRTGGWYVVTEEGFIKALQGAETSAAIKSRIAFIEDAVWDKIGLPREPAKENT